MFNDQNRNVTSGGTRSSILIVTTVIVTLLVAILFTLSDTLQERLPPPIRPTLVAQIVANPTPAPTRLLPQETATIRISAISTATPTAQDFEVDDDPTSTAVPVLVENPCGNVPDSWIIHEVESNDSLLKIAADSGATVAELSQANCLISSVLYAGSFLFIPQSTPVRPDCGPPLWWIKYLVRPGDTLFSLARTRGTTTYEIMQANCLVSSTIYHGRTLFLPPSQATSIFTPSPIVSATPSPTINPTRKPTAKPTAIPTVAPTSTAMPSATSSPMPSPTATLPPTATPTATATNDNQPTATPTSTPTVTPSPMPTATPTNTPTLSPTATTIPTDTPAPSATPTPTDTPAPTSTPVETSSPTPTVPVNG